MNTEFQIDLLRQILESMRTPESLDHHPWLQSNFYREFFESRAEKDHSNDGYELIRAVSALFLEMLPATPPKKGKRLDTRWGMFGLLGSQYFVPFLYGTPYPDSLRSAWGGLDRAILLLKFGDNYYEQPEEVLQKYTLVGNEPDVTPISTLSDWHVKGISRLAGLIDDRENHLKQAAESSPHPTKLTEKELEPSAPSRPATIDGRKIQLPVRRLFRWMGWIVLTAILVGLIYIGGKGWSIYQQALIVKADTDRLQGLLFSPVSIEKIIKAGPEISTLRSDLKVLDTQSRPFLLLLEPWLGYVPQYGQDLSAATELLTFADNLLVSVESGYQAALPLLEIYQSGIETITPQQVTRLLADAQPGFVEARQELQIAVSSRAELRDRVLSARVQSILTRLDPLIVLMDDGLSLGAALPDLLGAGSGGPKTYLLLVQNEDEIRPSGGFLTAVGSFVVKNGNVFGLQFEDAGVQEDWSLPYPTAPWQLEQYMNSPVLIFRDANWFSDFPTAVQWIEYLYAYKHKHTVDGIIAIDQHVLVSFLHVIGPIQVEGIQVPVTEQNVIEQMRLSKVRPANAPADWYNKAFISRMAFATLKKLLANENVNWKELAQTLYRDTIERHIMLQFDDEKVTQLLAKWDLDGTIRPGPGDFLMVVDSNVGFTKTNAVVSSSFSYDVDLTEQDAFTGKLVISHKNAADLTVSCNPLGVARSTETEYPIHYCYWNYLRVYVPELDRLRKADVHAVPAAWMILGKDVPARVDRLDEVIKGVQGYGTLMVVPGGQVYTTGFDFTLPGQVISVDAATGYQTYSLKIKKQPGTLSVPVIIRLHLPVSAKVVSAPTGSVVDGQNVLIEIKLVTDQVIEVVYSLK